MPQPSFEPGISCMPGGRFPAYATQPARSSGNVSAIYSITGPVFGRLNSSFFVLFHTIIFDHLFVIQCGRTAQTFWNSKHRPSSALKGVKRIENWALKPC